jgi:hypothetical protein
VMSATFAFGFAMAVVIGLRGRNRMNAEEQDMLR